MFVYCVLVLLEPNEQWGPVHFSKLGELLLDVSQLLAKMYSTQVDYNILSFIYSIFLRFGHPFYKMRTCHEYTIYF